MQVDEHLFRPPANSFLPVFRATQEITTVSEDLHQSRPPPSSAVTFVPNHTQV
jgi:hypothetical protein